MFTDNNKYKKIRIVALMLVLLLIFVACSGPAAPDDVSDKPGTEQDSDSQQSSGQPTQNPDSNSSDDNGKDESEGTAGSEGKTPEEILEGYYYGQLDQPIEDFELKDLDGNMIKLSDLTGKIVFLNFWATWCPPCREEMPHMQTFYDKYKDEGIIILAVNPNQVENRGADDPEKAEKKAREYIEEHGFTFPVLLDSDDSVWGVYQQRGIPANYVIDTEGMVKYVKPGAFVSVEEMEAFLEAVKVDTSQE